MSGPPLARSGTRENSRRSLLHLGADPDSDLEYLQRQQPLSVQQEEFDPGERIPSYESSQEQHWRRTSSFINLRRSELQVTIEQVHSRPASHSYYLPPIVTTTNTRSRLTTDPPSRSSEREWGRDRDRGASPLRSASRLVKTVGLKFLSARQHFLLATCRDLSLIPCAVGLCRSWLLFFKSDGTEALSAGITSAHVSEHFLTGIWCIVAGYLLFSVLDGLMVRWIVGYSITGAIVRMAAMSAILVAIEEYLLAALSAEGYNYALHTWILISCALTVLFIAQNFITSNIDLKGKYRPRFFDFYKIVVFAVVPVGMASFITMIGLLRSLSILRLDIDVQRLFIS